MTGPAANGTTPDLVIHRAQRRVIGHLTLDGTRYAVKSPPGITFARIQQMDARRGTNMEEIWDIVGSLIPELPVDVLHDLTLENLTEIISYALNPARTVEARAAAELARVHPKEEAAADSLQPITSATSAPASPSPLGAPIGVS